MYIQVSRYDQKDLLCFKVDKGKLCGATLQLQKYINIDSNLLIFQSLRRNVTLVLPIQGIVFFLNTEPFGFKSALV